MQTKLKISATILLIEDDYENLKKTINSIVEEVDNIFVISNKKIIYNDLKFTLIQDNKFDGDFSSFRNKIRESLPDHILFHLNCDILIYIIHQITDINILLIYFPKEIENLFEMRPV